MDKLVTLLVVLWQCLYLSLSHWYPIFRGILLVSWHALCKDLVEMLRMQPLYKADHIAWSSRKEGWQFMPKEKMGGRKRERLLDHLFHYVQTSCVKRLFKSIHLLKFKAFVVFSGLTQFTVLYNFVSARIYSIKPQKGYILRMQMLYRTLRTSDYTIKSFCV